MMPPVSLPYKQDGHFGSHGASTRPTGSKFVAFFLLAESFPIMKGVKNLLVHHCRPKQNFFDERRAVLAIKSTSFSF